MTYRQESDSLGTVSVPENAYYGAQTQRAVENFPVSGLTLPQVLIRSLALVKKFAAWVNGELGLIGADIADAVYRAADEIWAGSHADQFVIDVFQTGSGTSTNMNANEVIATRANEILTGNRQTKGAVHPNDHVNCCQSSNDVVPTAIHIAAAIGLQHQLVPVLDRMRRVLGQKAEAFSRIEKIGRTHLQDAVIMTLGDEFSGYARQVELGIDRLSAVWDRLLELPLGGTAVGTGLNAHPDFAKTVISHIAEAIDIEFYEAGNHFEAQASCDFGVEVSGALKTIAVSITKIANDIRWLASGPRCGLGEINIPAVQPGSSIMPGKVNPVICESAIQAATQVIGNDSTIGRCGTGGYFELNLMLPLLAYNLIQSIELLANTADMLTEKCVAGVSANKEKCAANIEQSLAVVTNLVPHIGYDRAAKIAQKAYESDRTVLQVAREENIFPEGELENILYGRKSEKLETS
ncbi:MAG: class II fumarate hydratase [Thermodesulfobacteriota bacterium]